MSSNTEIRQSKLAKSVLILSSSQFATAAAGIIRNKLLAVLLGPAGVGLFSQLQQFQMFASGVVPMGMQLGSLKYMAKSRASDGEGLPDLIKTASRLFLIVSILTVLICLAFIKPLSGRVLGDPSLYLYLIAPILGIAFIVQADIWQAYLQAGLEMKAYAASMMTSAAVGLVVVIPLVVVWKQHGAAFHLLLASFLLYYFVRRKANKSMGPEMVSQLKKALFKWEIVRGLGRFAGANILTFSLVLGVPFLVSTQIVQDAGLGAKGIYQAVFALASGYMMTPLNAINTYQLARLSQLNTYREICDEVNNTLKLAILMNSFLVMSVLVVGDLLIRVLFSGKFMPALSLLPWMMIASFFRFYTHVIGAPLLPLELFRARNVICVVQNLAFIIVFFAVPPHMRLQGAVWAEATNWLVGSACMYGYMHRRISFRISAPNWRLSAISLVALIAVTRMPCQQPLYRAAGAGVLILWTLLSIRKNEFRSLVALVTRKSA